MRTSNNKSSILYAILSNTIVLVLIGFFALLYFHTNAITNLVKESINVLVEVKNDSSPTDIENLAKKINNLPEVLKGSAEFVPKSEAAKVLGEELNFDVKDVSPAFKDIISFNVKASAYSEDALALLKQQIEKETIVDALFYENVVVENIKSNLNKFSFGILVLSLVFVFLAIVIIYNTINLSLYADRWEIKTMEIIGARDSFIRQPYLKIAGKIALVSFGIAAIIILGILLVLYFNFPAILDILKWYFLALSILLIFAISILITVFATITIVNKYLYKHESELY